MLQSVILLWKCAVRPGMSVFVMVCETRPLPVYPIVFRHPGLPVAGKHSVFNLINCHVRSFLLVSLIWHPACASNLRRRGWWKKPSPIFWIWTAIPSSTLHTAPLRIHLLSYRSRGTLMSYTDHSAQRRFKLNTSIGFLLPRGGLASSWNIKERDTHLPEIFYNWTNPMMCETPEVFPILSALCIRH